MVALYREHQIHDSRKELSLIELTFLLIEVITSYDSDPSLVNSCSCKEIRIKLFFELKTPVLLFSYHSDTKNANDFT